MVARLPEGVPQEFRKKVTTFTQILCGDIQLSVATIAPFAAVGDPVGEVPEQQGSGLGKGGEVLLQRVEQPRRRRARTPDCQGK